MFILHYFSELWKILLNLAPWLFFGAVLAGLLRIFLTKGIVNRHMGDNNWLNIIKTTLLGIPLPLCSCGVLPTTLGLKKDGASNGSAVSFLISTPQTGMDSILVTASFLGWPLALFKVAAAFLTGILGGVLTQATESSQTSLPSPTKQHPPEYMLQDKPSSKWRAFWNYSVNELIGSIYQYLAIGLIIAAFISTLVPPDTLSRIPGLQGIWGMLAMLTLSIPIYICTTGSVPIAASLVAAGLPIGSALVFLMAGPATNIATLAAVWRSFGKRITAVYLFTVILGSIAFGLLFQSFFLPDSITVLTPHHEHLPWYHWLLNFASASLLVALIARWTWLDVKSWLHKRKASQNTEEVLTLNVKGMTCENCAAHVRRAIEKLPNVKHADVSWKTRLAHIHGKALNKSVISQAVRKAGYSVEKTQ